MEAVVNLLARYEILELLYLHKISHATVLSTDSIVKLYTAILDYLMLAHEYFEPHPLKKLMNSIFNPEESTNKFVVNINQKETAVEKYLSLVSDAF